MDGRQSRAGVFLIVVLLLAQFASASAAEGDGTLARAMLDDAELSAVTFVDRDHGWAVGDRGVIWRTEDGGRNWQFALSTTAAALRDVCFVDVQNGWAAGGQWRPYLASTRGVLLRTHDGGRTWDQDPGLLLPAIRKIKFFSAAQGWAVAEPSAIFPSAVFCTDTGGQSWAPLEDRDLTTWTVADFADGRSGAVAGGRGARSAITGRTLEAWQQPEFGLREPRALRLSTNNNGWLAGDGGLLALTHDGGRSWQQPPAAAPAADQFDFRALEVRGQQVWVAGAPGSRVMHSPDGGASWEAQSTNQSLPINALCFADEQHGWAVGALGTILATTDGGRTWQKQRAAAHARRSWPCTVTPSGYLAKPSRGWRAMKG